MVSDSDDDLSARRTKRLRANNRQSGPSGEDGDTIQSSPGRSQGAHSRDDVPMTDHTDEVYNNAFNSSSSGVHISSIL